MEQSISFEDTLKSKYLEKSYFDEVVKNTNYFDKKYFYDLVINYKFDNNKIEKIRKKYFGKSELNTPEDIIKNSDSFSEIILFYSLTNEKERKKLDEIFKDKPRLLYRLKYGYYILQEIQSKIDLQDELDKVLDSGQKRA